MLLDPLMVVNFMSLVFSKVERFKRATLLLSVRIVAFAIFGWVDHCGRYEFRQKDNH